MKTATNFEANMIEYGNLLRNYDEIDAMCKAYGSKNDFLYKRLNEIGTKIKIIKASLDYEMELLARNSA